jgi:hypothetical protein
MLVAVQDALRLAILEGGRSARAADGYLPIVVPVTGFMSVAGGSHRYGAVMAAQNAPSGLKVEAPVFDTEGWRFEPVRARQRFQTLSPKLARRSVLGVTQG